MCPIILRSSPGEVPPFIREADRTRRVSAGLRPLAIMEPPMNVSIVLPAFNEEQGVAQVIGELRNVLSQHGIEAEILVIDDGSSDRTAQAAAAAGARVFRHRSNRGYGAALKSGIAAASNEAIVMTDADGTYPCQYIPEMLERLKAADMVVGARIGANVKIPA